MTRRTVALPLSVLALASCTLTHEPPGAGPDGGPPGPTPDAPDAGPVVCFDGPRAADRALLVNEPTVLARFGFDRVMTQLRASAGVAAVQTNKQLFQSWMKTFGASAEAGDCDDAEVDPNGYGFACPRGSELKLAQVDPFDPGNGVRFEPVALLNRFDLTPADGTTCGEYRIVYAMHGFGPVFGRALLIFEAALPNPDPPAGARGCLPIAQLWQSLNDDDEETRAARLEQLYFTGGAIPGVPPVIDARHLGLAEGALPHRPGQIRTNFFIDFAEWNLREYKIRKVCASPDPASCRIQMAHVPVADNPAPELFAGTHGRSSELRAQLMAAIPRLAADAFQLGLGPQFDELESVSSRHDVEYRLAAPAELRTAIDERLAQLGSPLTVDQVLNRATFQTCAGCHELSNFLDEGGTPTPPSLGFVHIDERGAPSQAMVMKWLPEREQTLLDFIDAHCGPSPRALLPADPRVTIGGARAGAHN